MLTRFKQWFFSPLGYHLWHALSTPDVWSARHQADRETYDLWLSKFGARMGAYEKSLTLYVWTSRFSMTFMGTYIHSGNKRYSTAKLGFLESRVIAWRVRRVALSIIAAENAKIVTPDAHFLQDWLQ